MSEILEVFLDGVPAGRLTRTPDGAITFDYAADAPDTPLSCSLPRHRTHHASDVVTPWLDNLLPEKDDVRVRWAQSVGEWRATPFDLLALLGADCAGAVQIVPEGRTPADGARLIPISDAEIGAHLRALKDEAGPAWHVPGSGASWTLGGQQAKFTLARGADGGWTVPSGGAPSTHIVKRGLAQFPGSEVAEYATTRAAILLGLPVPPVELVEFAGEIALVTRRFDRIVGDDGTVRRVHQEDLCQAMGLPRGLKYQMDGGPSPRDVTTFLRRALDPRDRERGVHDFARALVFNWLAAGTDAHAKNYSVLHVGARAALAPFYDLISAAFLMPDRDVHAEAPLSMQFGGDYRLATVDSGRLGEAAADLGVDEGFLVDVARTWRDQLPDAIHTALVELPPSYTDDQRADLMDAMAVRLTWVRVP